MANTLNGAHLPGAVQAAELAVPRAEAGGLVLVEYTDPYSVWCWGCEPALRRIEYRYAGQVEVRVVMGGLFEDFTPMREYWSRMSGGRWADAVRTFLTAVAGQHGMPINVDGMMESMEDFRSTWPACIAVSGASLQGMAAERAYLRRMREAALVEGRDIGARETQVAIAAETGIDADALARSLEDGSALVAFRKDLTECQLRGVSGFPSFDVGREAVRVRLEGYRSWEAMEEELLSLAPGLTPRSGEPTGASVLDALHHFGRCATREVGAVLGESDDDAEILLDELEAEGRVHRLEFGSAVLWDAAKPSSP